MAGNFIYILINKSMYTVFGKMSLGGVCEVFVMNTSQCSGVNQTYSFNVNKHLRWCFTLHENVYYRFACRRTLFQPICAVYKCVNLPVTSVNLDTSLVAAAMFYFLGCFVGLTSRGGRRASFSSSSATTFFIINFRQRNVKKTYLKKH